MGYGALLKGNLNNTCFSDKTPSVVFMGKATNKSVYGASYRDRGCSHIMVGNVGKAYTHAVSYCAGFGSNVAQDWAFIGATGSKITRNRTDNFRTAVYEIESFKKPVVFFHYNQPGIYGALLIGAINNGGTGPRGYPKWNVTVLLYYWHNNQYVTAANDITLYCFSEIDPAYTDNTGSGLVINDAAGGTMFHSNWRPAQVKGILDVNTSNPDFNTWTGSLTSYTPITKEIYLAKDSGRIVTYEGAVLNGYDVRFEFHRPIVGYSSTGVAGYTFHLGEMPVFQYNVNESTTPKWIGDGQLIVPIMDGADYD